MSKSILIFLLLLIVNTSFSQVDNVPADHPVYDFLKELRVRGVVSGYSDVVLPLSRDYVLGKLKEAENSGSLSGDDKNYLQRLIELIDPYSCRGIDVFDGFPGKFSGNILGNSIKHIYHYNDTSLSFTVDPLAEIKYIYSGAYNDYSWLVNFGGEFRGSYDGWLGFRLQAKNGIQFHNRNAAESDVMVKQNYTFNYTGQNYFDETEGYLRLQKGIAGLEIGRERILWGSGYIDRLILSDYPPEFDFIKFDISYKSLSYNFVHGWLVNPPQYEVFNSSKVKFRSSKYIAVSRLGFNPGNDFSIGASQVIIYGNRPPELAYLTPFLFWESAQRSLDDLDNSFLSFDGRYRVTRGLEVSASVVLDDINPKFWNSREWTNRENRIAYQGGVMLTQPLLPEKMTIKAQYTMLRPYIFSHYGRYPNSLSYTNNDFILGADMLPNSARVSLDVHYRFNEQFDIGFLFRHTLHGADEYDSEGKLVKSYGGDVFRPFNPKDDLHVSLLSGNLQRKNDFSLKLQYYISYDLSLGLHYIKSFFREGGLTDNTDIISAIIKLGIE